MELVGKHGFTSLSSLRSQSIGSIACLLGRELTTPDRRILAEALGLADKSTTLDNFMSVGRGFR